MQMTPHTISFLRFITLTGLAIAAGTGCGSDSTEPRDDTAGTQPAILVGVIIDDPDGRNIYVGAVPELPEGELDYSGYLELGNVDLSAYGGWVFAWERETPSLTRYGVREDFSLFQSGEQLSFRNYGAGAEFVGGELAFISPTRAYALSSELDLVVVWNPTTMEITGTIPMQPPDVPEGFVPFAHHPAVVGDKVIWEIVSTNADTEEIHHAAMLAIASAETDEPVRYATDERCAGANGGHMDEHGDYYVRADGYWGKYAAYGPRAGEVGTCVLRIRAGEVEFDPDYLVSMESLTGSPINWPWFHVEGANYLAWAWDPNEALPEDSDDYWVSRSFRPLLVDIERGTSEPYPDLEGTVIVSSSERELDGVKYYERSDVGYLGANSRADIVELRPSGIVHRFSVVSLWALARIR
jgi:hypothetical protein